MNEDEYKSTKYDLVGRKGTYENSPLIITKGVVKGLTLEMMREFREKSAEHMKKLSPNVTVTPLGEEDGAKITHQHMKMPMFVTNRSIINVASRVQQDDGSVVIIVTSQGTEDLQETHKDKIGSDVVAINHFNLTKAKEVDGGCEITICSCLDLAGSVMDIVKQKQAARQLRGPERMFHLMITGELLPAE